MAERKDLIVLHHPDLPGRELEFEDTNENRKAARAREASGWKRGPAPKSASAKKEG